MNYSILKKKTISSKEYFYSNFIKNETKQLFQVHQVIKRILYKSLVAYSMLLTTALNLGHCP